MPQIQFDQPIRPRPLTAPEVAAKPKKKRAATTSWRTTLGGILSAFGTIAAAVGPFTGVPVVAVAGAAAAAAGQALMGINARDHAVSSEQAGAK